MRNVLVLSVYGLICLMLYFIFYMLSRWRFRSIQVYIFALINAQLLARQK